MSEKQYSKRQINMMRVNALRSASSEAKNIFIAYLCGVHTLDFDDEEAKNYPEDYYVFKQVIATIPNSELLHDQINTYRLNSTLSADIVTACYSVGRQRKRAESECDNSGKCAYRS